METVQRGHDQKMPKTLNGHRETQAYYGVLSEVLTTKAPEGMESQDAHGVYAASSKLTPDKVAEMSLAIENIIEGLKIRDWAWNQDVLKKMQNAIR